MTFIYVVTTDGNNYLEEQAYLSQCSLKYFNPDAKIYTLTDQDTFEYLNKKQDCLLKKTSELIKTDCPPEFTMKQRSRFLKLTMREYFNGNFIFIDSDTIVCEVLSELEDLSCSVAMVYDLHIPYKNNLFLQGKTSAKIRKSKLNYEPEKYFNSGLIYTKDDEISHTFFREAFNAWKSYQSKDFCIDQVAFNFANHKMNYIIKELDGIYNCQVTENGLRYISAAKMIHYFSSTKNASFLLADKDILKEIRSIKQIPENVLKMIEKSRSCFRENAIIISDVNAIKVYNSLPFRVLQKLYKIKSKAWRKN